MEAVPEKTYEGALAEWDQCSAIELEAKKVFERALEAAGNDPTKVSAEFRVYTEAWDKADVAMREFQKFVESEQNGQN